MDEKRGRGRPRKKSSLTRTFMFRGTEDHERMLNEIEDRTGESRGEIMRDALEKYYYFKIMGRMTYSAQNH